MLQTVTHSCESKDGTKKCGKLESKRYSTLRSSVPNTPRTTPKFKVFSDEQKREFFEKEISRTWTTSRLYMTHAGENATPTQSCESKIRKALGMVATTHGHTHDETWHLRTGYGHETQTVCCAGPYTYSNDRSNENRETPKSSATRCKLRSKCTECVNLAKAVMSDRMQVGHQNS